MQYKVGDEVLVRGAITDVHEGTDHPYFVAVNYDSVRWLSEDKIIPIGKTYADGLVDAWDLAKKILMPKDRGGLTTSELNEIFYTTYPTDVFEKNSYEEALAKIEAYEKEIKVGDIVKFVSNGDIGCVTYSGSETAYVMWEDGRSGNYRKDILEKTGRTAESLGLLLRQIGE